MTIAPVNEITKSIEKMHICTNCSTPVRLNWNFCANCGRELDFGTIKRFVLN